MTRKQEDVGFLEILIFWNVIIFYFCMECDVFLKVLRL